MMGDRLVTIDASFRGLGAVRGGHRSDARSTRQTVARGAAATRRLHVRTPEIRVLRSAAPATALVLLTGGCCYLASSAAGSGRLRADDILALCVCVLIVLAGICALIAFERRIVQQAARAERRRIARDMHDGLAQELAFVAALAQQMRADRYDASRLEHLHIAAERALHESRTTIATLASIDEGALDSLIAHTAGRFRSRFDVRVDVDLEHVDVDAEHHNSLLRVVHEALHNAVRHGSAQRVEVWLRDASSGPRLSIADDGSGFDVAATRSAGLGLGLTSMHERAELLGWDLNVLSRPGAGTVVEVRLP